MCFFYICLFYAVFIKREKCLIYKKTHLFTCTVSCLLTIKTTAYEKIVSVVVRCLLLKGQCHELYDHHLFMIQTF